MSDDLTEKRCMPCEGGVLPFDTSEIHKYQKKVDGWDVVKGEEEVFFLLKKFKFGNFYLIKNSSKILKEFLSI